MRNIKNRLVLLLTLVMLVSTLSVPVAATQNESPLTLSAPAETVEGA